MKTAIIIISALAILMWIIRKLLTNYILNDNKQKLIVYYGGATKTSVIVGFATIFFYLFIGADIILTLCWIL